MVAHVDLADQDLGGPDDLLLQLFLHRRMPFTEDLIDRLADQFVAGPTGERLECRVAAQEVPLCRLEVDGQRDRIEHQLLEDRLLMDRRLGTLVLGDVHRELEPDVTAIGPHDHLVGDEVVAPARLRRDIPTGATRCPDGG